MNVTVDIETPRQKVVTEMLDKLDTYLSELYPPESNHFPETEQLSYSNTLFCVARYNDIALGCGAALLKFEQENAYAEIKRMYVHEEYRGEGVGGDGGWWLWGWCGWCSDVGSTKRNPSHSRFLKSEPIDGTCWRLPAGARPKVDASVHARPAQQAMRLR